MFEWDKAKANQNQAKHGVSFADTFAVFEDASALTLDQMVGGEERHATIGMDAFGRGVVTTSASSRRAKQRGQRSDNMRANYDFSKARRGAVVPPAGNKTRITIRLDRDLVAWFKSKAEAQGGGSYQTMLNDALRAYTEHQDESLEKLLRKVVREELKKAS